MYRETRCTFAASDLGGTSRNMRIILFASIAVCATACAHPSVEALRYTNRYDPACKRLEAETQSSLDKKAAPPSDSSNDASTPERPEALRDRLSKPEIKAVIEASLEQVRACYVEALRGWPKAEGDVRLRFEINASGRVDHVSVLVNETDVSPLACCIADVARTWAFRARDGAEPEVVSYPFHLNQAP
jgi:hypothetical protein